MNTRLLFLTIIAIFVGIVSAVPAVADELDVPPGRWWDRPGVVRLLALSAEQQRSIQAITLTHARAMVDLKAGVERAELDLRAAAEAEPFAAERVREAFGAFVAARTRLETERFEMILRIREVLTREQWQRLRRLAEEARLRGVEGGE
ncbi:MAG: periplasmic heavy metal sensor, partial [Acidobacteriota bacterium]